MAKEFIYLCGARDFHAIDWYRSAKELLPDREILILTDLIEGEGFTKLINDNDKVIKLIIIDKLLFRGQSRAGNVWRNVVKLLVFPIQVHLIKKFSKEHPSAIYHAHSMYYLFLAWAAGVRYIGTPQGSDILVKPYKSILYKYFAIKSLQAADAITVDSTNMREKVNELSKVKSHVIQNGIDINNINTFLGQRSAHSFNRSKVTSPRGMAPLYRIRDILVARNSCSEFNNTPLTFIYPFFEGEYKQSILPLMKPYDKDLGRLDKSSMYELLAQTKLVLSIPLSDSSPRSVYEAIFCGSAVAITYNTYYDALPQCMKSRIILIDLDDKDWFNIAFKQANIIVEKPYYPSEEALNMFDQRRTFKIIADLFYN